MKVSRSAFRRRHNYALAVASEVARPALKAIASVASRGGASDPKDWRRGLIIGHSHIGDVLYRTCSLNHLSLGLPACKWDFLTSPAAAVVLGNNAALHAVVPLTAGDDSSSLQRGAFTRLRAARYDVALCTNTVRALPDFVLAAALGIPNRIGFGDKGYSGLLTWPVGLNHPQPLPAYFRAMVGALLETAPDWPLEPRVFPRETDEYNALRAFQELPLDPDLPTIACTATTRQLAGAWPASFFGSVLASAVATRPANVVLFGAVSDRPTLLHLAGGIPSPTHVVSGQLDWLAFAEALRRCDVLLAMDSGPRHLANAVGTPVLFARNLSFSSIEAGRYCANEVDLAPQGAEYMSRDAIEALVRTISVRDSAAQLVGLMSRRHG
ncbi:MAG: glycosyltransferase family 9 protein [bacterium]